MKEFQGELTDGQKQVLELTAGKALDVARACLHRIVCNGGDNHPNAWWRKYNRDITNSLNELTYEVKQSELE